MIFFPVSKFWKMVYCKKSFQTIFVHEFLLGNSVFLNQMVVGRLLSREMQQAQ